MSTPRNPRSESGTLAKPAVGVVPDDGQDARGADPVEAAEGTRGAERLERAVGGGARPQRSSRGRASCVAVTTIARSPRANFRAASSLGALARGVSTNSTSPQEPHFDHVSIEFHRQIVRPPTDRQVASRRSYSSAIRQSAFAALEARGEPGVVLRAAVPGEVLPGLVGDQRKVVSRCDLDVAHDGFEHLAPGRFSSASNSSSSLKDFVRWKLARRAHRRSEVRRDRVGVGQPFADLTVSEDRLGRPGVHRLTGEDADESVFGRLAEHLAPDREHLGRTPGVERQPGLERIFREVEPQAPVPRPTAPARTGCSKPRSSTRRGTTSSGSSRSRTSSAMART